MKILIVSNFYPPYVIGGAEIVAHWQAQMLASMGHELQVFAGWQMCDRPYYKSFQDTYQGIKVTRLPLENEHWDSLRNWQGDKRVLSEFYKLLMEFEPDIVHFHNLNGLGVQLINMTKAQNIKAVVTLHDNWGFCYRNTTLTVNGNLCQDYFNCKACSSFAINAKGNMVDIMERVQFIKHNILKADLLITPSASLRNNYICAGFPAHKFAVVPNGIQLERFKASQLKSRPISKKVSFVYIGYIGIHGSA